MTGSSKSADRTSVAKRLIGAIQKRVKLWHLAVFGGVLLLLLLWTAWGSTPDLREAEKAVLGNLEPYGVRYELDDNQRVIRLILEGGQVTDAALDEVPKLPHLKRLSLHKSSVTDAGLLKLRGLKRLQALGITDTQVTDRGLSYLEKMPSLRYVWVCENAKLTSRGITSLQRAVPGLKVYVMNRAKKKDKKQVPG